ncbi:MAG: hypothetical protein JWO69_1810 [Thermoleophilia bacterium]|nr:hypothetical protein [Thermoleophilia bacterium]
MIGAAIGRTNLGAPRTSVPRIVTTPPPATVTKPTGPTAQELDRAVPASKRGEVASAQAKVHAQADATRTALAKVPGTDAQQAANAIYAEHYAAHPYYVDPKTDRTYAAEFDPKTGKLTLDRTKERIPGSQAPSLPPEPPSPFATIDDNYANGRASDVDLPPTRRSGRSNTQANSRGPFDGISFERDEHVVMTPGGAATLTAKYTHVNPADEGLDDITIVEQQETDADDNVTSYAVRDRRTRTEDGGTVTTTRSSATADGSTTAEWTTKRIGADKTSSSTKRVFDGSRVSSDTRTMEQTASGATITQSSDTRFEKGTPTVSKVHRSATIGTETKSTNYDIAFDEKGFANDIKLGVDDDANPLELTLAVLSRPMVELLGADAPSAREPLDAWIDERLGVQKAGTQRLGFGRIGMGSSEADGSIDTPVYLSDPGVRTVVDGKPVFIEGESIAASRSLHETLDKLQQSLDASPHALAEHLESIDLLTGRSPNDANQMERYDDEHRALASASDGGVMTYWGNSDPGTSTTRHELAHLAQQADGPSHETWVSAMRSDVKTDVRDEIAAVEEDRRHPLAGLISVEADTGVSDYAEKVFGVGENEMEDFADSVALYLDSRDKGGVIQVREEDGSVTTYDFEDLFPARAKILEGYLNLSPTSPVPAPTWELPQKALAPMP